MSLPIRLSILYGWKDFDCRESLLKIYVTAFDEKRLNPRSKLFSKVGRLLVYFLIKKCLKKLAYTGIRARKVNCGFIRFIRWVSEN